MINYATQIIVFLMLLQLLSLACLCGGGLHSNSLSRETAFAVTLLLAGALELAFSAPGTACGCCRAAPIACFVATLYLK